MWAELVVMAVPEEILEAPEVIPVVEMEGQVEMVEPEVTEEESKTMQTTTHKHYEQHLHIYK
jgi:hypothetical protein